MCGISCWLSSCFVLNKNGVKGIDWASEGLRQEPLEFEDKFSSTWGGPCREIYHLTSFRKKKVISHDSDIKWKRKLGGVGKMF
jgi:hypothetical protein